MQLLYYTSVFLHIVCASFWIGGMLFLPLVVLPGIKNNPAKTEILFVTGMKFRFYGWLALTLLVVTGVLNMYFRGIPLTWNFFSNNSYGKLVIYKVILFLAVILLSFTHDFLFGNKALAEMQKNISEKTKRIASWSGRLMLLFSLAIAFIGVLLSRGGNL